MGRVKVLAMIVIYLLFVIKVIITNGRVGGVSYAMVGSRIWSFSFFSNEFVVVGGRGADIGYTSVRVNDSAVILGDSVYEYTVSYEIVGRQTQSLTKTIEIEGGIDHSIGGFRFEHAVRFIDNVDSVMFMPLNYFRVGDNDDYDIEYDRQLRERHDRSSFMVDSILLYLRLQEMRALLMRYAIVAVPLLLVSIFVLVCPDKMLQRVIPIGKKTDHLIL